jgi:hypothetical protein
MGQFSCFRHICRGIKRLYTNTRVVFNYNNSTYKVLFTDEGCSAFVPDSDQYTGKAELLANGETVLGLNIHKKMWPDYERWRWSNIFAFVPGEWMKDLIEISTIIEKRCAGDLQKFHDDDVLARAKNIRV